MIRTGEISNTLLQAANEKDIDVIFYKELEFDVHMNQKINKAYGICAIDTFFLQIPHKRDFSSPIQGPD